MPFNVERRSEICKRNNNRPGCCWYLCDNPKNHYVKIVTVVILTVHMMFMK